MKGLTVNNLIPFYSKILKTGLYSVLVNGYFLKNKHVYNIKYKVLSYKVLPKTADSCLASLHPEFHSPKEAPSTLQDVSSSNYFNICKPHTYIALSWFFSILDITKSSLFNLMGAFIHPTHLPLWVQPHCCHAKDTNITYTYRGVQSCLQYRQSV